MARFSVHGPGLSYKNPGKCSPDSHPLISSSFLPFYHSLPLLPLLVSFPSSSTTATPSPSCPFQSSHHFALDVRGFRTTDASLSRTVAFFLLYARHHSLLLHISAMPALQRVRVATFDVRFSACVSGCGCPICREAIIMVCCLSLWLMCSHANVLLVSIQLELTLREECAPLPRLLRGKFVTSALLSAHIDAICMLS